MKEIQQPVPLPTEALPRRIARRLQSRNAMALVGIMLVLMLVLAGSLIGFAGAAGRSTGDLGSTSSNMLQMTRKRNNVLQAETLADAGVRAAVQWIAELPSPPVLASAFSPMDVTPTAFYAGASPTNSNKWTTLTFPAPGDASQGQFRVRFYPHSDNAVAAQRGFLVESVGTFKGETRVVRADIRQKNFAQYAYFTDTLSDAYFIAGLTTFNGPVHVNNSTNKDMNIVWDSVLPNDKSRLFQWNGDNTFTMWQGAKSGNSYRNVGKVKWRKDSAYVNPSTPTADADWKKIITPDKEGTAEQRVRTGPQLTADKVELPKSSDELRDAAIGGASVVPPTGSGVYVPTSGGFNAKSGTPSGGVYIRGQVDDMVLEATGTGNRDQNVYIYQNSFNTKFKLQMKANGETVLERFTRSASNKPFVADTSGSYPRTYNGSATNGVIYSHDDIGAYNAEKGGVSGTIANSDASAEALSKLTLATRVDSTGKKTINIDGNILYANATKEAVKSPDDAGVLGMVAERIRVLKKSKLVEPGLTGFNNYTASSGVTYQEDEDLDNLSIHGTLMAYNTIAVDGYDTRDPGEFRLLGGYIAKDSSKFGQTVGGTGLDALNVKKGFKRILNYDKRVANQPPPYFPGTGQAYETLSYQRVLEPLQP
ncbi:MAG: hypothetical protein H7145_16945 [Akkermansiaceae bacterium]|nr:hypothetical protein [Armatimonadota bacterium]